MHCEIVGSLAQHVLFEFERDDQLWLSNGSIMSHTRHVEWSLQVPAGLSGALRRSLSGEGMSLTHARATSPGQHLRAAPGTLGHIRAWDLSQGPLLTTRGAFLAAWGEVDISVTVARRAGAALFGGAGLFLQHLSGQGTVLIQGSGDLLEHKLHGGESQLVSTGHLAAFSASVDYGIEAVGGVRKLLFGGEGLFMTRLCGPGTAYLQSLKRASTAKAP
ncbi:AIM24 family protein [Deinococcus peraridilitoris]|nr:AIM24 family protein [Deinococcus peraridilitoris]